MRALPFITLYLFIYMQANASFYSCVSQIQQNIYETYTGCERDGYTYTSPSGTVYDERNPIGEELLQDSVGCNYVVIVNLEFIAPEDNINIIHDGTPGDGFSYTSPSGIVYNESNPIGNEILSDTNGCEYYLNVNLDYSQPFIVSVEDFEAGVKISPNPSSNFISIVSKNQNLAEFQIFSSAGKLVHSDVVKNSNDISHLQKGIYFILVDGIYSEKLVKL